MRSSDFVLPLLLLWVPAAASGQKISYTTGQARDGAEAYVVACVACHGRDLSGEDTVPALTGPVFAEHWNGKPALELFEFLRGHMPQTFPGLLNDRTYLVLLTFLLYRNGVPPGEAPLTFATTAVIPLDGH
jgi:hypothetical protein